ncbi:MAG: helix-turn-helix transcriptional regulator [Rhodovibrio sp.]|nr:helix-turn-helix transcriptional regulator [Rhodovibrio sp.]
MATSNTRRFIDSEDLEAELIEGLKPEMRERVLRVRGFAEAVRQCVRRLRQERCDWTQRELANRIGVSTSTISRLENGRGFGGIDLNILALAFDAMDVAPRLMVLPVDDAAGWRVSDPPARNGPGVYEDDTPEGGRERGGEITAVAASASGATTNPAAEEVSALREEVHALRRDLQDLRQSLSSERHADAQRSR